MKRPYSLSIFFPSYNEEDNIPQSVREADAVAQRITDTYEIIVVDDGSRDHTGEMADRLAKEYPNVRVVHHSPNKGCGAAMKSGFAAAKNNYIFFTDADLQFDLNELEHLFDYVPEYDVVLGYRSPRRDPFMRIFNAWGWNTLNRFLFGLKVHDIDCAFKLFKREVIQSIPIKSDGAMISAEMLIRMKRRGIVWKEVPVTHKPRHAGVPTGANPSVIVRAFKELIRLYRGDLGGSQAVTYLQAAKYAAVGVANTAIDFAGYVSLTRFVAFFAANAIPAKTLSFFLATIFSFMVNRRWTFERQTHITSREVFRFYSITGLNLLLNVLTFYLFVDVFRVYDLLAFFVATILTFIVGFISSKLWVFSAPQKRSRFSHGHAH